LYLSTPLPPSPILEFNFANLEDVSLDLLCSYDRSFVLAKPITGRSHQLRVHLSHIGFPIVGDKLYGGPPHPDADSLPLSTVLCALARAQDPAVAAQPSALLSSGEFCEFCNQGPYKAFKSSQLLQEGAEVLLHSYCYALPLLPGGDDGCGKKNCLTFYTELPWWWTKDVDPKAFLPAK